MRRSIRSKASIPWTDEGFASQARHCLLCAYEVFARDRPRALAVLPDSGTPSGASAPNASEECTPLRHISSSMRSSRAIFPNAELLTSGTRNV